jgi:hypothetical protein
MEEPKHHKRYRVAWDAYRDPDTPRECFGNLRAEMDDTQKLFSDEEWNAFKKTLDGFEEEWENAKKRVVEQIEKLAKDTFQSANDYQDYYVDNGFDEYDDYDDYEDYGEFDDDLSEFGDDFEDEIIGYRNEDGSVDFIDIDESHFCSRCGVKVTHDNHSGWGESNEETADITRPICKACYNERPTVEGSSCAGCGCDITLSNYSGWSGTIWKDDGSYRLEHYCKDCAENIDEYKSRYDCTECGECITEIIREPSGQKLLVCLAKDEGGYKKGQRLCRKCIDDSDYFEYYIEIWD